MALFLMVPGAWHGAWCWASLTPLLQKAGHKVLTPDLAAIPPGANPLPVWTAQISQLAESAPEKLVLLGHSRGGMVINEVAARLPEHVRAVIYLSAFLLPEGETLQSAMDRPEAGGTADYLRPARGRCLSIAPDAVISRFYHLAPTARAQEAAARLHPEPVGTFSAPATIRKEQIAPLHRIYIECSEDRAIPLPLQRAMQSVLPCDATFTLTSDHSPFISQPEMLAALLNNIATSLPLA